MSDQFDLNSLLEQAMNMQQQLAQAQQDAAARTVSGTAAAGKITATMSGAGELVALRIAPELVDPATVDLLEDLVVAAIRDAQNQVAALQQQAQEQAMGPLAGGLGGFGGLLGS
ncbi:MAG: YbaB/EbfC family nucleoid-associated protein [Acidimicrobiia bacterium]